MKPSQRIIKNLLAGGASTIVAGAIQLGFFVLLARYVTIPQFGMFSFMLTFAYILQSFANQGFGNILVRDMAIAPEKTSELLSLAISLGWLLLVAATVLVVTLPPFLHFRVETQVLTALMCASGLAMFMGGCYGAVLLARERNELFAAGVILQNVILLLLAAVLLRAGLALRGAVPAFFLSNVLQWLFYRWLVIRRYAHPHLGIDLRGWKALVVSSAPIGGATVARQFSEQADVMALATLASARAVGLFSAPFKITAGLRFVGRAMMIALFPTYSRAAGTRGKFHEAYDRGLNGFLNLSVPLALPFIMAPETICVGLIGSRYRISAEVMRLLGIGVLLQFLSSPFPFLLTALNEQRFLFASSALGATIRIGLDFGLTPKFGFLGPCFSLLLSDGLMLAMWIGRLWQLGYSPRVEMLWRPLIGGAAMAAILHFSGARSLMLLSAVVTMAVAVYFFLVVKLGAFSADEVALVREGIGFLRPFLNGWSRQLRGRPL